MNDSTKGVLVRIRALKKELPGDWAEQASIKMKKEVTTIRKYATGERGVKKGQHIELLKVLYEVQAEHQENIKNLLEKRTA